jgi:hypothetical protein
MELAKDCVPRHICDAVSVLRPQVPLHMKDAPVLRIREVKARGGKWR